MTDILGGVGGEGRYNTTQYYTTHNVSLVSKQGYLSRRYLENQNLYFFKPCVNSITGNFVTFIVMSLSNISMLKLLAHRFANNIPVHYALKILKFSQPQIYYNGMQKSIKMKEKESFSVTQLSCNLVPYNTSL